MHASHSMVKHLHSLNVLCLWNNATNCRYFRKFLSENKHVKYLYIPYTDAVVVVTCNPMSKEKGPPKNKPKYTAEEALQHVRDLYLESLTKYRYGGIELACKTIFQNIFFLAFLHVLLLDELAHVVSAIFVYWAPLCSWPFSERGLAK